MITKVKTEKEIKAMRVSGQMLAAVMQKVKKSITVGMTTSDISRIAHSELKALGGSPAFLGYGGFPDIICISINEEVVHGIPSKHKTINDGDIVSCDFGVIFEGMITDAAISVIAGKPLSDKDVELVAITKKSLDAGIKVIKDGTTIGTIGNAIEQVLSSAGLGIVRDFVGHGVGHELHEEPGIPNYGQKGHGFVLRAGMTIAVEPMATLGLPEVRILDDNWTVTTVDQKRSAHFEDTILVTETGSEVLTRLA